ncbi:Sugar-specific transcriptional regulator TrmB [Ignavigranum ruoffiae]|uniref:Sugar-specific transcriptional regulator TrmB n=1 Tax=Ignavigranum ruoffiae TaxID=89093 RepID=A0A1H9GGT0_9LACT|nr:TrmB family transcriptional regulator [Ignavigranum ruoffiae]SEQ49300.1 Sugar-specific transcriptional regulator TrmB [Ignavigranum ruoffiae]
MDIINLMKQFDFSESETKVYLTLLQNGILSGYETARLSGVARSKVYEVLANLVSKGVVRVNNQDKVSYYQAESSEFLIEKLRLNTEKALHDLSLATNFFQPNEFNDQLWHMSDYQAILLKTQQMIEQAEEEILLHIWVEDLTDQIQEILLRKEKSGLKIVIILFDLDKKYTFSKKMKNCYIHGFEEEKLEERHQTRWINLAVDNQEMIYASIKDCLTAEATYTSNKSFVFFSREYVQHDAYCLRIEEKAMPELKAIFGENLIGIRDIFKSFE